MNYHKELIDTIEKNQLEIESGIEVLAQLILDVSVQNKSIWLIGNGGSASSIEHFETDLSYLKFPNKSNIKLSALSANSSLITAASNDISFQDVFSALLQKKSENGDLLIAVSASGNSKNIIKATLTARNLGLKTFGLIGFDGGLLRNLCDYKLVVTTGLYKYELVEDIHLSILHAVKLRLL